MSRFITQFFIVVAGVAAGLAGFLWLYGRLVLS